MASKNQKKKFKTRMLLFVPICLVLVVTLAVSIGKYWVAIVTKYNENIELNEKLVSLKEEEAILSVDVEKLQDPEYIARYAREKYLYSKDDEIIIMLPEE